MKNLQTLFGVTKQELIAVLFVVSGLVVGSIVKFIIAEPNNYSTNEELSSILYRQIDSIATAQKKEYVGVNDEGNAFYEASNNSDSSSIEKSTNKVTSEQKGSVNINAATKAELMKLPGIGEKTAEKIIEYRKEKPFHKISDIMNVKGIGEKKFEKMREFLQVK